MQILHLKTRIKRENSILTGHLTAVKVGVIYCSGGVTAVYCTTQVHPPVGELRELHSMQCVISVSSNWCLYLAAIWPSCAVTIPPIYSSQLSAAWSPPELCLGTRRAGEVTAHRLEVTGGGWGGKPPARSQSSGQTWPPSSHQRSSPHPHHYPAVESQFGYKKFWLATSRVLSRLTSISGTKTGF